MNLKKGFFLLTIILFIATLWTLINYDIVPESKSDALLQPQEISVSKSPPQQMKITVEPTPSDKPDLFFKKPVNQPKTTSIKIYKKLRVLELYGDSKLIGKFKIALGGSPEGDKEKEGDSKTPEGKYYICSRTDKSNFTYFLGLNYPNTDDAKAELENDEITREAFNRIENAERKKLQPPWDTSLGGAVGIHGGGNKGDWTLGCIALSDEDIKILWKYTVLKTPVEIFK